MYRTSLGRHNKDDNILLFSLLLVVEKAGSMIQQPGDDEEILQTSFSSSFDFTNSSNTSRWKSTAADDCMILPLPPHIYVVMQPSIVLFLASSMPILYSYKIVVDACV